MSRTNAGEAKSQAPVSTLNWGQNSSTPAKVLDKARRCISCKGWTVLLNPAGDPQHKVCAEAIEFGEPS